MSWIEDARETHIAVTFVGDDYETCLVCSQPAPCLAIRLADELAEANAAIERVRALRGGRITEGMIERAIHPSDHQQCPDCGGWDGFHGHVTRSVMGGEGDMAYGGIMSSPCPRRGEVWSS